MILVSILRTHCLALDSEDFFFSNCFSIRFIVVCLIFKIMIHFVFVQDITCRSVFFSFFNLWMSICSAPFVEKAVFAPLNSFVPLSEIRGCVCADLFLDVVLFP